MASGMSKHYLCGVPLLSNQGKLCVSLPPFYSANEREREERFPFRKSGDKRKALNAETPEGIFRVYPHKANSLSLNPSNCAAGQVLAAKITIVTEEMNKFRSAPGTKGVGDKERARRSLPGMFPEAHCERHLGTERFDKTNEAR